MSSQLHGYGYWQRREQLVPRERMWEQEEAKSLDERRRRYQCRNRFVTLEAIPGWDAYRADMAVRQHRERLQQAETQRRWIERQREAYASRKARHEAKKQRLALRLQQRQAAAEAKAAAAAAAAASAAAAAEAEAAQPETPAAAAEEQHDAVAAAPAEGVVAEAEPPVGETKDKEGDDDDDDQDEEEDGDDDDDDDEEEDESELSSSEEEPVFEEVKVAEEKEQPVPTAYFAPDEELNQLVTMWRGDITHLEIDAIVNAANRSMLGGGGIDGAIHRAAGDDLYRECKQLNGCATGHCKITRGYDLPAKYVIHTVGPIGENAVALRSCYLNCLRVAVQNGVRSIAFCGISTGIYGYPLYEASHIALLTVRRWLEEGDNRTKFDKIIFCVFLDKERTCYEQLLPLYFPTPGSPYEPLARQPFEEHEVPPMVQPQDSSSSSSSDEEDNDGDNNNNEDEDEDEDEDANSGEKEQHLPKTTTQQANDVEVNQLAAGVEALAIIAPSAEEGSRSPAAANEATPAETAEETSGQ